MLVRRTRSLTAAALATLSWVGFGAASKAAVAPSFSGNTGVTADTQVLHTGTTVFAYDRSNSTQTVNGVTFTGSATQNAITLSGFLGNAATSSSSGGISAAFATVLSVNNYNANNAPGTLTFSGLTNGTQYQLQLFAGTNFTGYNGANGSGSETVNGTTLTVGGTTPINSFTTATFVADATGQATITLAQASGSTAPPIFNAVNLQAVPEPACLSLLAFGGLGLLARRRRTA